MKNFCVWSLVLVLPIASAFHHTSTVRSVAPASTSWNQLSNLPRSAHARYDTRLFEASTVVPTTSEEDAAPSDNFFKILWRFSRPHTIIGSALAIPALHILAAPTFDAAFTSRCLSSMLFAMIPACLMNVYITGLNQVTDVDIDKINKPDLPIAAGDLSIKSAILTILISLVLSLTLGASPSVLSTPALNQALWWSGILGTLYSLEPFRLKRYPFLAAFCIVAIRGAVINACFFAHAKAAAFGSATSVLQCLSTDLRCSLSSLYFAVFGVVIALMKDVPDVKGDAISNIRTFSVRMGPKRVFRMMTALLSTTFLGVGASFFRGALVPTTSSMAVRIGRGIVGTAAILAGMSVRSEAAPVDPENSKEVYSFYMHLWKLFYLSYFVLPFAR